MDIKSIINETGFKKLISGKVYHGRRGGGDLFLFFFFTKTMFCSNISQVVKSV